MLTLITAPTENALTLDEVKAYLRVNHDDDDTVLTTLLAAAHARLDGRDGILGRCLRSQVWELRLDTFPGVDGAIELPLPPTIGVASVKYLDANGDLQTLATENYTVQPGGWAASSIKPVDTWPSTDDGGQAVRVQFTAGYESEASPEDSPPANVVPENIRLAMLMLVADWYDNRGNIVAGQVQELPVAVGALLAQHRIIPVA